VLANQGTISNLWHFPVDPPTKLIGEASLGQGVSAGSMLAICNMTLVWWWAVVAENSEPVALTFLFNRSESPFEKSNCKVDTPSHAGFEKSPLAVVQIGCSKARIQNVSGSSPFSMLLKFGGPGNVFEIKVPLKVTRAGA
jgi:hypothetical protein